MNNSPKIELKILDPRMMGGEYPLPCYASPGAAGLDLRACLKAALTLEANEVHMVPSGIAIHIVDPGYVGVLLPRSGLGAKHGIVLGNLCGVIDSDYTGEIIMALWNRGAKPHTIEPGERVCQLLILPVAQAVFHKVTGFTASSKRQAQGFGSTGSK